MARKVRGEGSLDRAAWIAAAKTALKKGGVGAVRIEALALALKATPGSFYWHFKKREDLLDALVADWSQANMKVFEAALRSDLSAERRLIDMALSWIVAIDFSPDYDSAIRDWARISTKVFKQVRSIDQGRIDILTKLLINYGFERDAAPIRARIIYFHQVGYYALNLGESRNARFEMFSEYFEVLMGRPMSPDGLEYLAVRRAPGRGRRVPSKSAAPLIAPAGA